MDGLLQAAFKVERAVAREWAAALAKLRAGVDVEKLAAALERGDVMAANALLSFAGQVELMKRLQARTTVLRELGWATARREVRGPVQVVEVALGKYAQQRPDVLAFLRDHALRRVTDLTNVQTTMVRQALTYGAKAGLNPRETATLLRDSLGLHPRQAQAVLRFASRLQAAGDYNPKEVARYADRQLRLRAETIARTETMQALNEGRRMAWGALQAEGTLNPADWVREWVIAPDERVCEECEPFDGAKAPPGEPFVSRHSTESMGPPLHPRCRCTERLVPWEPPDEEAQGTNTTA